MHLTLDKLPTWPTLVDVIVVVDETVIVAALVNGNDTVGVIDAVDEALQIC